MKTVFDAVQKYPVCFTGACQERGSTTPSRLNEENHKKLKASIELKDWDKVKCLLSNPDYFRPLEGIILVSCDHGDMPKDEWIEIIDMYDNQLII